MNELIIHVSDKERDLDGIYIVPARKISNKPAINIGCSHKEHLIQHKLQ